MQELIQIIKQKRKESDISNTMLRFVQFEAEKLLEMEKQQIKECWQKAQERSYSEEEVFNLIEKAIGDKYANLRYWFEQFKKK